MKAMVAAVNSAWKQMQKEAAKLEGKVEAAVRPRVAKINDIKDNVEGKIRS
jgi:hypothetical protein